MALFAWTGNSPRSKPPRVGNVHGVRGANQLLPLDTDGEMEVLKLTSRADYPNDGSGPWFVAKKPYGVLDNGVPISLGYGWYPANGCDCVVYSGFDCYKLSRVNPYAGNVDTDVSESQIKHENGVWYIRTRRYTYRTKFKGDPPSYSDVVNITASCAPNGVWGEWVRGYNYIDLTPAAPSGFSFKYNEESAFYTMSDTGIVPSRYASGLQTAYVNACQAIPKVGSNSIANIVECFGVLKDMAKSLKGGAIASLAKSIKQYADPRKAWLAYRYAYTTTKLDIEEYNEFIQRTCKLRDSIRQTIPCDGWYSEGDITYHVSFEVALQDVLPQSIAEKLEVVGIRPTLLNAWDMVPYSFVVDWVLPIGDLLSYFENWSDSVRVYKRNYWFTVCSEYDTQSVFFRTFGRDLNVPPHLVDNPVSDRTIRMRVADAISLFS